MKFVNIFAAAVFAALACACGHSHDGEAHVHDESIQMTLMGGGIELFAEAMPFVAGQESHIKVYISSLDDFKPVAGAGVTATLTVDGNIVRQTAGHSETAGVYGFELAPGAVGNGKLTFDIERGGITTIETPVTVYDSEHEAHEEAAHAAVTSSNGVAFTKPQSWKIDFATAVVEPAPFAEVIRTTARVQPAQGDEMQIVAKTPGVVLFSGAEIVPGRAVAAGSTLFAINGAEMADDNLGVKYVEAEAEYNRAKAEYDRKRGLAEERIVSSAELLEAETAFITARIVYENMRGNFSAEGCQLVSSPIAGFVQQVMVRNGEYVEAGQTVLSVSRNRDLLVRADLPPRYHASLGGISSANIRLTDTGETFSLEQLGGSLVSYGRTADGQNPLVPVTFRVRNNGKLLPGGFVEMFIRLDSGGDVMAVPNTAIVEEMGARFVFVQLTGQLFEKRAVETGATDGFSTVVTAGIAPGERIVTKGAVSVKLAQAAGVVDPHSGHAH